MRRRLALALLVALALAVAIGGALAWRRHPSGARRTGRPGRFATRVHADRFQRGNVHTHSTRSDGTAPLEDMVRWYREHGYQFLAMTEHDRRLDPGELAPMSTPDFVVLPGEEVTDAWQDHPLHVNALCARATIPGGRRFESPGPGLAEILAEVRAEGGIPLVNHPNFQWTLEAGDIVRGASGRYLLEIWSGLPAIHASGTVGHPSEEAIWDDVLAAGGDALPVAVDDAHGLPGGPNDALPGRGWLEVFGAETSVGAICAALAEGRFFASSGPVLARLTVGDDTFVVSTADPGATVAFLDQGGEKLAEVRSASAPSRDGVRDVTYRLRGGESLVRARITDAQGRQAWTPAYRVAPR